MRVREISSIAAIVAFLRFGCARIVPPAAYRSRWTRPHCGLQEQARRRSQIARGMLTESNGLVPTA